MRHNHAVIVIVLYLIEEIDTVLRLKALGISEQDTGIGICRLIGHRNIGYIGFQSDNHRFVSQSQSLHLMCCHAHYQCFTGSHLVVAYSAAVLLQHPNAVLLRLVY